MAFPPAGRDELETAAEQGRVCALATDCLRDLRKAAATYPELFPPDPFGPSVFSGVALANAFGSPGATADGIRIAARTALWAFAADWLVDYTATSRAEIDAIVDGCAAVGEGAEPAADVPLQRFLADLRDELSASPGWPELAPVWREHLRRYLDANAREWRWKSAYATGDRAALPTLEDYLDNADNFGSSLVNVGHWIHNGFVPTAGRLARPAEASAAVQRVLRLVNDLATYERDLAWGDLNSLMLGLTRAEVSERIGELVADCERLLGPLSEESPREAGYLRRQLGYSIGYYGMTDYWGTLGEARDVPAQARAGGHRPGVRRETAR